MKQKNSYIGYQIFSHILKFLGIIIFGGKVIGKENIPKDGGFILAGNHLSDFDSYLLFMGTKRPIHIISKKELLDTKIAWFFRMMHIIPVDRKNKNEEAVEYAISLLKEDKIVGIFPEGTYHKEDLLLPFKPGAIHFSEESNKPIIPFAIKSSFKFRCHPTIEFGKPIYANDIKEEDKVKYLENKVREMLTK